MTDSPSMSDDERAAAAFRTAFEREAGIFEPVRLEVRGRRRRRWLAPLAVAAAVAVIAAGAAVLLADEDSAPRGGDPVPPGNSSTADDSALRPGWRYESIRDVQVQVPNSWGYGQSPASDWCAGAKVPRGPYVDVRNDYMGILLVGCMNKRENLFGNMPRRLWSTHVALEPVQFASGMESGTDGRVTDQGWTRISQQVGAARITVWTDEAHLAEAERIVASAVVVEVDHNGCRASAMVQSAGFPSPPNPFDIAAVDLAEVDSVAVCQYDRNVPSGEPGLVASRVMEGVAAQAEVAAIAAAPAGGGPDRPQNCSADMYGDLATVLQVRAGDATRELFVYRSWCFGNGIDDGVAKRALTRDNCAPLFADRVRGEMASAGIYEVCGLNRGAGRSVLPG